MALFGKDDPNQESKGPLESIAIYGPQGTVVDRIPVYHDDWEYVGDGNDISGKDANGKTFTTCGLGGSYCALIREP